MFLATESPFIYTRICKMHLHMHLQKLLLLSHSAFHLGYLYSKFHFIFTAHPYSISVPLSLPFPTVAGTLLCKYNICISHVSTVRQKDFKPGLVKEKKKRKANKQIQVKIIACAVAYLVSHINGATV